jgi:nucleoside-diphosphate-sugar epimerase
VPARLLLDEIFPNAMAEQLNAKGHDVRAVVASPEFAGRPDEEILIGAVEAGRALVTADIKDFMPIDARYRAAGRVHAGLIMVSTKTFPRNRTYVTAVTSALDALLSAADSVQPGGVIFLTGAGLTESALCPDSALLSEVVASLLVRGERPCW